MNFIILERNQGLITSKGGARLLASTASRTDDPQTLRMVAGAIANLCGNGKLRVISDIAVSSEFLLPRGFYQLLGTSFAAWV